MRRRLIMVLGVSAILGACHKQPRVAVLPVPVPRVLEPIDPLKNVPDPPSPDAGGAVAAGQLPVILQPSIQQQAPPPARRRRVAQAPPAPLPSPEPPTPPVVEESLPQLGQILTQTEQRTYNRLINQDLQATRASLASISMKKLGEGQQQTYRQILMFVRQAEKLSKTDLLSARGLSRKANLLAKELAASQRN
jgi:hypothetical protein